MNSLCVSISFPFIAAHRGPSVPNLLIAQVDSAAEQVEHSDSKKSKENWCSSKCPNRMPFWWNLNRGSPLLFKDTQQIENKNQLKFRPWSLDDRIRRLALSTTIAKIFWFQSWSDLQGELNQKNERIKIQFKFRLILHTSIWKISNSSSQPDKQQNN